MPIKKKRHAGFVIRNCLKGDGFSAHIRAPKKMNMKVGRGKLSSRLEKINIIRGKTDEFTSQPIFLVSLEKPDVLIFYLGNWDLESNSP